MKYMNKLERSLKSSKTLNLLGIANKANKIVVGPKVLIDIKSIRFIFIANDSSLNSQKKYKDKCAFYKIKYSLEFSSEELSIAIGQVNRNVIGITDLGFSKKFVELNEGG